MRFEKRSRSRTAPARSCSQTGKRWSSLAGGGAPCWTSWKDCRDARGDAASPIMTSMISRRELLATASQLGVAGLIGGITRDVFASQAAAPAGAQWGKDKLI